jgi:uncharacterized spore protein YtfJ
MSTTASTSTSTSASTFDPPAGWDAARIDAETSGSNPLEQLADVVLSRILSRAGTRTVFGEPVVQGDITVVPVAKVSTRFGFGGGSGNGPGKHEDEDKPSGSGSGSGMGGGGDVRAKPLGYIEITSHDSRFIPIEDGMEIGMVTMKFLGVALVLVALRFLLRRGGKHASGEAEVVADEGASSAGKRRLRVAQAVPWGTVASVVAAASKAQRRARRAA